MNTENEKAVLDPLAEVVAFLLGESELEGCAFGEVPADKTRCWWRKHLRAALQSQVSNTPQDGKVQAEVDDDGENQALRVFLMGYGGSVHTIEGMRDHLHYAGFDDHWPEWANDSTGHLTKLGAQNWIRHLIAMEQSSLPPQQQEQSGEVMEWCATVFNDFISISQDEFVEKYGAANPAYVYRRVSWLSHEMAFELAAASLDSVHAKFLSEYSESGSPQAIREGAAKSSAVRSCQAHIRATASQASRESQMVTLRTDESGNPTVWCDPEIADLVDALNTDKLSTVASCSGHGHRPGRISLKDGRELLVMDSEQVAVVAEYEALRRDAERYRYALDHLRSWELSVKNHYGTYNEKLTEEIDAAINEGGKK